MKNNAASSFDSAPEHYRVSWGRFVRAQNLQPEQPGGSSPGLEFVINPKAPLPSAAELSDYDRTCPGTADRIVSLLEKQVEADIARANRKQIFAAITGWVAIIGGFILLWYGRTWGAIAFIITFAELIGISVGGMIRQAKAYQEKIEHVRNAVVEMSAVDYSSKSANEKVNGSQVKTLIATNFGIKYCSR